MATMMRCDDRVRHVTPRVSGMLDHFGRPVLAHVPHVYDLGFVPRRRLRDLRIPPAPARAEDVQGVPLRGIDARSLLWNGIGRAGSG
jgi:hypothetical protein